MNESVSRVLENKMLAKGIYQMTLETPEAGFRRAGQFVMLALCGKYLRRPISVSSCDEDIYTIIYKLVGAGTEQMSRLLPGEEIDVLTGLGNGYDIDLIPDGVTVVGGGIGIPPMLGLARELSDAGRKFRVVLGYNNAEDVFLVDEFRSLCGDLTIMTADGSLGQKGLVTDVLGHEKYICACGPTAMLKALVQKCDEGQFSLEARMGCGFGACMGCSVRTLDGSMRVCKEGPVFDKKVIKWEAL